MILVIKQKLDTVHKAALCSMNILMYHCLQCVDILSLHAAPPFIFFYHLSHCMPISFTPTKFCYQSNEYTDLSVNYRILGS